MKRGSLSLVLGLLLGASAAEPSAALVTNVREFYAIAPENTSRAHRFRWDLDILYSDPAWNLLWVENAGLATFISTATDFPQFATGQRVRFEGERCSVIDGPFAETRELIAGFNQPVFLLGGVGPEDAERAGRIGAQGVAGIRAFWPT